MDKAIWITTTRYSALFRRILERYTTNVVIMIDGKRYSEHDISHLLSAWCTNDQIKQTHNFRLMQNGKESFSFHDGPKDVLAAYSELPFIKQLRSERLIRYEVVTVAPLRASVWRQISTAVAKMLRRDRTN